MTRPLVGLTAHLAVVARLYHARDAIPDACDHCGSTVTRYKLVGGLVATQCGTCTTTAIRDAVRAEGNRISTAMIAAEGGTELRWPPRRRGRQ